MILIAEQSIPLSAFNILFDTFIYIKMYLQTSHCTSCVLTLQTLIKPNVNISLPL